MRKTASILSLFTRNLFFVMTHVESAHVIGLNLFLTIVLQKYLKSTTKVKSISNMLGHIFLLQTIFHKW